ncbi:MAG: hypothetical protein CEO22_145 [Candidatus Berkelbacteria bacterium Gr01-1014_85]|uniref:HTH cro/C1-type domain-containing protein n=1 Tax=Candidatus Berkelbacteria bacterium Gr01-1014_85 TaxID=2017150 RepID=A0A554JDG8_9BACT|nr:MAG: hypothetical protein CEO22_145 [Candidatus Berkelbacteria bacterium Gr01-1014_85]
MKIVLRVKELRKDQQLTQEELARSLNISRQSLISLEQGRWLPSLPLILEVARFFNRPVEDVITVERLDDVALERSVLDKGVDRGVDKGAEALPPTANLIVHPAWGTVRPPANLRLLEQKLIIEILLPGFTSSQIDLEVTDRHLIVEATNPTPNSSTIETIEENEQTRLVATEFSFQRAWRQFDLPLGVIPASAKAKLEHGILTISLNLREPGRPISHHFQPE